MLADPRAAAAATAAGQIALTVDGLPVNAHVVGVLRRFPTIASGDAGFIVADEATLAAALDASLPGQGRADELSIDTARPGALRAALNRPPLRTSPRPSGLASNTTCDRTRSRAACSARWRQRRRSRSCWR